MNENEMPDVGMPAEAPVEEPTQEEGELTAHAPFDNEHVILPDGTIGTKEENQTWDRD